MKSYPIGYMTSINSGVSIPLQVCTISCMFITLTFIPNFGGFDVKAYFLVKPNITRKLGLLGTLGFTTFLSAQRYLTVKQIQYQKCDRWKRRAYGNLQNLLSFYEFFVEYQNIKYMSDIIVANKFAQYDRTSQVNNQKKCMNACRTTNGLSR